MKFTPTWEGLCESYSKRKISLELWKFKKAGYEFVDMVHEAWLAFDYCRKYTCENHAHFFSLFKKVLNSRCVDIAKYELDLGVSPIEYPKNTPIKSEAELLVLLTNMPKEVEEVLNLILNTPTEIIEQHGINKKGSKGWCNTRLCEMLGYNPNKINLVKMVDNYFLG